MIIIPVYNMTVLPDAYMPFPLQRYKEIANKEPEEGEDVVFLLVKEPKPAKKITKDDIYPYAVEGKVKESKDGFVIIEGRERVKIESLEIDNQGLMTLSLRIVKEVEDRIPFDEGVKDIKKQFNAFFKTISYGKILKKYLDAMNSYAELSCGLSPWMILNSEERYALLKEDSLKNRDEMIKAQLLEFLNTITVSKEAERQQEESNRLSYRENAIRKQIDYLQKELHEIHGEDGDEIEALEKKINEAKMNEEAYKECQKALKRLKVENESSAEYGLLLDYLNFMVSLPLKKETFKEIDLKEANKILDRDHSGLVKVKKRMIEELSMMNRKQSLSGSILLFAGAPGTGKTSIASAIAEAMNRPLIRISLGGVHDEAEIRGHRRTYIGSMAGRIMNAISKCDSSAPVILLDEIDKLSQSYNGDPQSALLEVLDPEQNNHFTDHYLNAPYDLSDVLFIATANNVDNISEPLFNRMELIPFDGYTRNEKREIAKKHLIKAAMKKTGIKASEIHFTDSAIDKIIDEYTSESGVRELKRAILTISRKVLVELEEKDKVTINAKNVEKYLSDATRHDKALKQADPGIVTGLAYTAGGGEILYIETLFVPGEGKLILTGQLGDVMKESAEIAYTLLRSIYPDKKDFFKENDLHLHVPEGAIPKDGPSAGITLLSAMASLVLDKSVDPHIGMTGELSLRGDVTAIGGLNEKLMAADRAGLKTILIPKENLDDLKKVPDEIKNKLKIIPVKNYKEAFKILDLD